MPVIPTDGGRLIDYPEGTLKDWVPPEPPYKFDEDRPGHALWVDRRRSYLREYVRFGRDRGWSNTGEWTKATASKEWRKSRRIAEKQVEDIKDKIDLDAYAQEALTEAVTVMRGPVSAKDKLSAARLVLDFTKAKPAAKSEVTVNTAEDWLKSLGGDKD